jgi:methylornithine synthase
VVTSIVPPDEGLAGVANPCLDIETARRSLEQVLPVLEDCNLSPATAAEYQDWIIHRCISFKDLPN